MTAVSFENDVREQVHGLMPELWGVLIELVKDRSIYTDPDPPLQMTAEKIAALLVAAGVSTARAEPISYGGRTSAPLVLANEIVHQDLRTVLLYAHYDVQPADPLKWSKTKPFEPKEYPDGSDTRLYGRGAADDKSGVVMHLGAIKAILKGRSALPVNLKIVFEGEEETGESVLDKFLAANPEDPRFQADVIVIGDTGNVRLGVPTLTQTLRGIVMADVVVETLKQPVHSGMYGGPAPDAFMALVQMLAALQDSKTGDVAVPGLDKYDHAWPSITEESFRADAGVLPQVDLIGTGTIEQRLYGRPSINVVGLTGLPSAEHPTNVICPRAEAQVSMRLAPNQKPEDAYEHLSQCLLEAAPWGIKPTITKSGEGTGYVTKDGKYHEVIEQALMTSYQVATVVKSGQGGSIPLVNAFGAANPDADIILWGSEEPRANIHGNDESVSRAELEHMTLAEALLLEGLADPRP